MSKRRNKIGSDPRARRGGSLPIKAVDSGKGLGIFARGLRGKRQNGEVIRFRRKNRRSGKIAQQKLTF